MAPDATLQQVVQRIAEASSGRGPIRLMEVCGTHTVSLFRSGVRSMLPPEVKLISGPGCPVCVTSQGYIDAACELARRPEVMICTYGDMVRVPGCELSLEQQRAQGARVKVVYSARDAVAHAVGHPDEEVVFLAVGFETTTPATAAAVLEAEHRGVENFTILPGHKLVTPAMLALLADGDTAIDGFLCPGHVSIIIGAEAYRPIVTDFGKPCVVAGFEPAQMLAGIRRLVELITAGEAALENVYEVAVGAGGNPTACDFMERVFTPGDAVWRAMGVIPGSGLELRDAYRRFDARERFGVEFGVDYELPGCRCGAVIQGKSEPVECPLFGTTCTPTRPVGPCMVSSEGACAAWFKYNRPATAVAAGRN